jgi:hypothetical protein
VTLNLIFLYVNLKILILKVIFNTVLTRANRICYFLVAMTSDFLKNESSSLLPVDSKPRIIIQIAQTIIFHTFFAQKNAQEK